MYLDLRVCSFGLKTKTKQKPQHYTSSLPQQEKKKGGVRGAVQDIGSPRWSSGPTFRVQRMSLLSGL